jgi:type IV pilus assembly protein PilW
MARSWGFSLVELLVAMALGLVVVLGGVVILSESQVTSATVSDSTRLQLKADSVMRNIGFHASQSGAVELIDSGPGQVVFSDDFTGFDPSAVPGNFLHVHGTDGGPKGSDKLRISYEDNGNVRDCLGQVTTMPLGSGASRVDNEYSIVGGSLVCRGASKGDAQAIADGVEDLQVTYTIRTSSGGAPGATNFRTTNANGVAAADWRRVTAISLCLRMVGGLGGVSAQASTVGCRGETIAADGKLRRVVRRTIALRNNIP